MNIDEFKCLGCDSVGSLRSADSAALVCTRCDVSYPVCEDGRPVLIAVDNELFKRDDYLKPMPPRPATRRGLVPSPSVNLSQHRVIERLGALLAQKERVRVLVIGAGLQRAHIRKRLTAHGLRELELVCTDIDRHADVDCFCDAHDLPFAAGSFDALITTAVLEHVLYPEVVAAEIARVVRLGGFVYSELPFMQQVHEGAYDFTRYTLSGHRRLLDQFRDLESGAVAGPGTALVWALESFFASWFTAPLLSKMARIAVRLPFFWLKYFDYLVARRPAALDGASCTYLLGERIDGRVPGCAIVAQYRGARHLTHT